jgi:hypothetical protein
LALVAALVAGTAQAALLANWTFDESSGAFTADATGNGFTANSLKTDGIAGFSDPTAGQPGAIGTAFKYDFKGGAGSGQSLRTHATVGDKCINSSRSQLTLSTWFKADVFGTTEWSMLRDRTPSATCYNLGYNTGSPTEYFRALTNTSQSWLEPAFARSEASEGVWHMMTFTFVSNENGMFGTIYLDGEVKGTHTKGVGTLNTGPAYVYLSGGEWGTTYYGNHWENCLQDDTGVWDEALGAAKVAAMYNTPMMKLLGVGATLGSTGHYGQLDMETLFKVFEKETGPADVYGQTWSYSDALYGYSSQAPGSAWYDATSGTYNVLLGAAGAGVTTGAPIPEPGTLALLAAGLLGLLAYAWRKRR